MQNPLRVYLDSSDFSVMSDPGPSNDAYGVVLKRLRDWTRSGEIECYFSGTLLCEIAPINSAAAAAAGVGAALRRAELLVELCEQRSLISQDRLILAELAVALGSASNVADPCSQLGDWYPDGSSELLPVTAAVVGQDIKDFVRSEDMNRQQRRKVERALFLDGKPRAAVQAKLASCARTVSLESLEQKLPLRPQDARTLMRYCAGDATADDAVEALRHSLRDINWMISWFSTRPDKLTPFTDWVRKPAATILPTIHEFRAQSIEIRRLTHESGGDLAGTLLSSTKGRELQQKILESVAHNLAQGLLPTHAAALSARVIDDKCPGLSTGIRALLSAWWQSTGETPRVPIQSDLVDGMHAMYAPYVDIFRADSFMSPHIAPLVKRHGTVVVPKLLGLVSAIQAELARRSVT